MFVFLFCTERSGSNFVTSLMGGHSKVNGSPPSHLFRLFGLNEQNYLPTSNHHNWSQFVSDFVDASKCMIGDWDSNIDRDTLIKACPNQTIAEALDYMYEKERQAQETVSFIKENHTYLITPFILENWPNARFVHMVRDPRDVAASWICTPNAKGGVKRAVEIWLKDQMGTINALETSGIHQSCCEIRYEDLIADTKLTLMSLCRHLNLEFEDTMLEFYTDQKVRRNAKRVTAWRNLAKPVLSDNSGKYTKVLSETDIRYIELNCHRLMKKYGYNLDSEIKDLSNNQIEQEILSLEAQLSPSRVVEPNPDGMNEIRLQREAIIQRVKSRVPVN